MSKIHKVLCLDDSLKKTVRGIYKKSEADIKQDLEILYDWWRKQPHLPFVQDDEELERLLMRNKFRVEQTKKKLDVHFTLKSLYPEYFDAAAMSLSSAPMRNVLKVNYVILMPKPTPTGERILYYSIKSSEAHDIFNLTDAFSYIFQILEVLSHYDYCASLRMVCDLKNCTFGYWTKCDPAVVVKGMKIFQEGYSARLAGIDYINAPSFMELIVKLINTVVKEGKIQVHESLEKLHQVIPKESLPQEAGGCGGRLQDLEDTWLEVMEELRPFVLEKSSLKSDEKKRVEDSYCSELFGTDGTFKKLNLD